MRAFVFILLVVSAASAVESAAAGDGWTAQPFYTLFPVFTLDVHACYPEAPKGLTLSLDLNLFSVRVRDWTEAQPYQFIVHAQQWMRSNVSDKIEYKVGPFDSYPYQETTTTVNTGNGNVYGVAVRTTIPTDGLLATFEVGVGTSGEDEDACFSETVHYSFACRRFSADACARNEYCDMFEDYCLQKEEVVHWNLNSGLPTPSTDTHAHTHSDTDAANTTETYKDVLLLDARVINLDGMVPAQESGAEYLGIVDVVNIVYANGDWVGRVYYDNRWSNGRMSPGYGVTDRWSGLQSFGTILPGSFGMRANFKQAYYKDTYGDNRTQAGTHSTLSLIVCDDIMVDCEGGWADGHSESAYLAKVYHKNFYAGCSDIRDAPDTHSCGSCQAVGEQLPGCVWVTAPGEKGVCAWEKALPQSQYAQWEVTDEAACPTPSIPLLYYILGGAGVLLLVVLLLVGVKKCTAARGGATQTSMLGADHANYFLINAGGHSPVNDEIRA
jgi:hypothetical protein